MALKQDSGPAFHPIEMLVKPIGRRHEQTSRTPVDATEKILPLKKGSCEKIRDLERGASESLRNF
jgi:hypothetical protein